MFVLGKLKLPYQSLLCRNHDVAGRKELSIMIVQGVKKKKTTYFIIEPVIVPLGLDISSSDS